MSARFARGADTAGGGGTTATGEAEAGRRKVAVGSGGRGAGIEVAGRGGTSLPVVRLCVALRLGKRIVLHSPSSSSGPAGVCSRSFGSAAGPERRDSASSPSSSSLSQTFPEAGNAICRRFRALRTRRACILAHLALSRCAASVHSPAVLTRRCRAQASDAQASTACAWVSVSPRSWAQKHLRRSSAAMFRECCSLSKGTIGSLARRT
jgi:hypothetical protein